MATVIQMIGLYRRILDYLMPIEPGILGWSGNGFFGNDWNLGLDNMRSDNGRFFYTGLGSGRLVPEKIRGIFNSREVDGAPGAGSLRGVGGVGDVGGALDIGGVSRVGSVRGVGGLRGFDSVRVMREVWRNLNNWSAWNVGNNRNRGMESTALNAANALNSISAAGTASKQNAWEHRLGVSLENQFNGKRILERLAPIDRSLEITGRGFSVMRRIRGLWGDQNGFSKNRKTGREWGTRNAFPENKRLGELGGMQNAFSRKKAAVNAIGGFEEDAERLAAIRGLVGSVGLVGSAGRESGGETMRLGFSDRHGSAGGYDADELIDTLCGAFRAAAFSMSEGVHY